MKKLLILGDSNGRGEWEQDRLFEMYKQCDEYAGWLKLQPDRFPDWCHMGRDDIKVLAKEINDIIITYG
jgi:hypothetical protein